jgi:hypothetical protein
VRLLLGMILGAALTAGYFARGSWVAKSYEDLLATPEGKSFLEMLPESAQKELLRMRDDAVRARRCSDACEAARNACESGIVTNPTHASDPRGGRSVGR